jgi:hypothetical protein
MLPWFVGMLTIRAFCPTPGDISPGLCQFVGEHIDSGEFTQRGDEQEIFESVCFRTSVDTETG